MRIGECIGTMTAQQAQELGIFSVMTPLSGLATRTWGFQAPSSETVSQYQQTDEQWRTAIEALVTNPHWTTLELGGSKYENCVQTHLQRRPNWHNTYSPHSTGRPVSTI